MVGNGIPTFVLRFGRPLSCGRKVVANPTRVVIRFLAAAGWAGAARSCLANGRMGRPLWYSLVSAGLCSGERTRRARVKTGKPGARVCK